MHEGVDKASLTSPVRPRNVLGRMVAAWGGDGSSQSRPGCIAKWDGQRARGSRFGRYVFRYVQYRRRFLASAKILVTV